MSGYKPPTTTRKKRWEKAFLAALAETGNISASAKAAGIGRERAHQLRREDPEFDAACQEAIEKSIDALELEARRRAKEGVLDQVYYDKDGNETGRVYKYSDTLMIFLLKAHRPQKYRENRHITQDTNINATVTVADNERMEAIAAMRDLLAPYPEARERLSQEIYKRLQDRRKQENGEQKAE